MAEGAAPADKLLRDAQHHLSAGNIALASFYTSEVLDQAPAHPAARALLDAIAAQVGLRDRTLAAFAAPADGLLVIKAFGHGFWSEIGHVLGCLLVAELTGRTPVTLWGANCRYGDDATPDAFRLYFEALSNVTPDDLFAVVTEDFFPGKWANGNLFRDDIQKFEGSGARLPGVAFLGRPERIAVADFHVAVADLLHWIPHGHPLHGKSPSNIHQHLAQKYLTPTAEVRRHIAVLDATAHLSEIEIAVHARGSDKAGEIANLDEINAHYLQFLPQIYKGGRVMLLTDDERLIPPYAAMFGDKLVVPESIRQEGGVAPHFRPGIDKVQAGMEAARDVYAAVPARTFLGNGRSNFSCMVPVLRPPGAENYLIGGDGLSVRSAHKFLMQAPPADKAR